jgi:hypothetical protein
MTTADEPLRLDRLDSLVEINALPDGAALTFGRGLTVIYGRNGAGKSGFVRILANACFSRSKPDILPNIYDGAASPTARSAVFHVVGAKQISEPIAFTPGAAENSTLKRITVFDASVGRAHISSTTSFDFKPTGFDIFPEMARVYGELSRRLDAMIRERPRINTFGESFIGEDTDVSIAVASLCAKTELPAVKDLAQFGDAERARLAEVERLLGALKSQSPKELLVQLRQAKGDVATLTAKIRAGTAFDGGQALQGSCSPLERPGRCHGTAQHQLGYSARRNALSDVRGAFSAHRGTLAYGRGEWRSAGD